MNRKEFIRNTLLGLAAAMLPEILRPSDVVMQQSNGILWQIRNKTYTELYNELTEQQMAELKLKYAIELTNPPGLYIDLGYLRKTLGRIQKKDVDLIVKNLMYEKGKSKTINEAGS